MRFRPSPWWALVPLLALLWIMVDRPRPQPPHVAEWLDAGGTMVRTVRAGRGDTTMILLHGYGESLTTWRAIFDRLTVSHQVIALDLPGFGGSAKPDVPYSLPAITGRLSSFIDQWTTGPLILVGHSMGGEVAASLALTRPDRVKLLILIAPAGYRVGFGMIVDSMYPEKAQRVGKYLSLRSFVTPIHDPGWLAEPDSAAEYDQTEDPTYARSAARTLEDFDFRALQNRFADLTQPTLLIWGGNDPVIPFAVGDTISRLIPCVRFVPLPTAFHRPHAEKPDTVLAEIGAFLRHPRCIPSGEAPSPRPGDSTK